MGIISPQIVKVCAFGSMYQHLQQLGYSITYGQPVDVDIGVLLPNSHALVQVSCDICGAIFERDYSVARKNIRNGCPDCRGKCVSQTRIDKLSLSQQQYHDYTWLYQQYIVLNRSAKDIANECGVIVQTIESVLISNGIKKRLSFDDVKLAIPRDDLYDMYVNQGIGIRTIASKYPGIGEKPFVSF